MIIKPDYNLKSVYDIDLELLKKMQIKVVMFDLDSTLMISKSGMYLSETLEWLNVVSQHFTIAVISNNKNEEYLSQVRKASNWTVIGHASKPNPQKMANYLKELNISPKEAVMVGDRPLTDILAGKLLGCKTILVDSINADFENKPTRFVRWLERIVIRR